MTVFARPPAGDNLGDYLDRIRVAANKGANVSGDGRWIMVDSHEHGSSVRFNEDELSLFVESSDFLSELTSAVLISGHQARWIYSFRQTSIKPDTGTLVAVENGITGEAYNLLEFAHVAEPASTSKWYVWSIDAHMVDQGNVILVPREVGYKSQSAVVTMSSRFGVPKNNEAVLPQIYTFSAVGGLEEPADGTADAVGGVTEGSEAAATDSWLITSGNPVDWGVNAARTAYFQAGNQLLYGYGRTQEITAGGRVKKVSTEARYTIESPELCP